MQPPDNRRFVFVGAGQQHHVRGKFRCRVRILPRGHHRGDRLGDAVVLHQDAFDLAQVDPVAADLHLGVGAAQILDVAVLGEPPEIAGAIKLAAGRREGVVDELVGGQVGPADVPAGHSSATETDLADLAVRHGVAVVIEQNRCVRRQRLADHHRTARQQFAPNRRHGRLGRPVRVQDPPPRPAPPLDQLPRARLAADQQAANLRQFTRDGGEQRRHAVHHRDASGIQEVGQFGTEPARVGRADHQRRAHREGGPDLFDGEVERDRHALIDPVARPHVVHGRDHVEEVADARLGDQHAFGAATGPGGIDDVRVRVAVIRVFAAQIRPGSRQRPQVAGRRVQFDDLAFQSDGRRGQIRRGQNHVDVGIFNDVRDPIGR